MRTFLLFACVALVYGRPEPPIGYSYSSPSARYPSSLGNSWAPSQENYRSASIGRHSIGLSAGYSSQSGLATGGVHSSAGTSLGKSGSSFGGDSSFGGGYAGGYSGAPLVQKHIYVHVPPPEPVEQNLPRISPVAPPQKHYKIIFIKAPAPPAPTAPIIPVQPQNEEKTLVYVLVKKPEEQPEIVIPTAPPTQPSKPEVYFIKYQTQKESSGLGGGAIDSGAIAGGAVEADDLSGISVSAPGASGHSGDVDFGASGADAGSAHSGVASSQYGPPGYVSGPLHS